MSRLLLVLVSAVALGVAFSADAAVASHGSEVFKKVCSACHGKNGEGKPRMGPAFVGNEFIMESEFEVVADVIRNGRMGPEKVYKEIPLPMMPQKKLTEDELIAVTSYLKKLASRR